MSDTGPPACPGAQDRVPRAAGRRAAGVPRRLAALRGAGGPLVALGVSAGVLLAQHHIPELGALGYLGAFLMMLSLSAALFLPSPVLVLNVALGEALPSPLLTGVAIGLGSALGELTGYLAGRSGNPLLAGTRAYRRVEGAVRRHGPAVILGMALIPNPFADVTGIVAGALGIGWWRFLLITGAGRTVRAVAIAYAGAQLLR
ncbi:MAG TPA: VTT domain-containing protein [Chloroflexota bacterium]|nr:VTT domain-containing protein [Chloroflexota bacterium]